MRANINEGTKDNLLRIRCEFGCEVNYIPLYNL